jgi:lysophospholipase L1-like esterase
MHQRGAINWFQMLNNSPFEAKVVYRGQTLARGAAQGIGGEFSRQILTRLEKDALSQKPDILHITVGTNDIKNSYTAKNVYNNIILMVRKAMQYGVRAVWIDEVTPRNNDGATAFTAAQELERLALNRMLRSLEDSLPGFVYAVSADPFINPATGLMNSLFAYDGLHLNSNGALLKAKQMTRIWKRMGGRIIPRQMTPAYNSSTNPYGNIFVNPDLTGTGGTISTGGAGVLPDNTRAERSTGSQATYVASIVNEADMFGNLVNKVKLDITSDGSTADTEVVRFRPLADITTNISAGGWYEASFEIEMLEPSNVNNDPLRSLYITWTDQTTNGLDQRIFSSRWTSSGVKDIWPKSREKLIYRSQPIYLKGVTGLRCYILAEIDGTVAGSRTIKICNPQINPVPPPILPYTDRSRRTLLWSCRGADFQSTADQWFEKEFAGSLYAITDIVGIARTGGATVACAGGIYTAVSKGGTALVAAAQSWIGMSAANKITKATLGAACDSDAHTANPILSLTTGSTAAVTGDVLIYGYAMDE